MQFSHIMQIPVKPNNPTNEDIHTFAEAARLVITEARSRMGISQSEMGNLLRLSQGQVSRIETGQIQPPIWAIMYFLHYWPDLMMHNLDVRKKILAMLVTNSQTADSSSIYAAHVVLKK